MSREVPVYGIEDRVLIVPLRLVARYPRHAEFVQDRRNVLVLELDGPMSPSDAAHERGAVMGFDVRAVVQLGIEHVEVVGHDRI